VRRAESLAWTERGYRLAITPASEAIAIRLRWIDPATSNPF
jgi:hypothetical protein